MPDSVRLSDHRNAAACDDARYDDKQLVSLNAYCGSCDVSLAMNPPPQVPTDRYPSPSYYPSRCVSIEAAGGEKLDIGLLQQECANKLVPYG